MIIFNNIAIAQNTAQKIGY